MRLLVLSFYFPPDLSACSFRMTALVEALRERAPPHAQIDVITTAPNRYHSFAQQASALERQPGVEIRRIALPPHRSDVLGQVRAFATFARAVLRHTANTRYDLVFATSSRLMTAVLGAAVARRAGIRLYLDIRDIFADTVGDLIPAPWSWPMRAMLGGVERWTIGRATHVNVVSRGFAEYFRRRYPGCALGFVSNGIDEEFVAMAACVGAPDVGRPTVARVVYAGNIGDGQALHEILPNLARRLAGRATFVVVGDGSRRAALEGAVAGIDNVELRPPMSRKELLEFYRSADVLFLHLGAVRAFEKVLPSKLFEYAALGKPILAGVSGYAAEFVRTEIDNASVFPPTDEDAAVLGFEILDLRTVPRPTFVAKFARTNLSRELAEDIWRVARSST